MAYDLLVRNARLRDGRLVDLAVSAGRIVAIEPRIAAEAAETIDAGGRLLSPPLVEPHCHLDAALTEGLAGHNRTGTLLEGIQRWAQTKPLLTVETVKERAKRTIEWYASQGALVIRSHVDVCDPNFVGLRALLEVREEMRDLVDLQLVAFPQEGILSYPGGGELLEEALRMGCDVVGAIPHYEMTREMGVESLRIAFELAERYDRPLDAHCDETDDDQSRFVEVMAAETIRRGLQGRVVASHTTAMGSYNNAYAFKLFGWLKRAELSIVANPPDNSILQGRFDTYPKRRGLTRVKELLEYGINVAFGHDSVMDPWYPLGTGNMLHAAWLGLHLVQLSGYEEIPLVWDLVTTNAARALGILDRYGIDVGKPADFVVFDAANERDALRMLAPALWCVKRGRIVARASAPRVEIRRADEFVPIRYERPGEGLVDR
ncbi:MAG: cytosine deaminase [Thermomicrobium sp.]|nr:cytosine deaminase [Thermomicrobium sp.]MDW8059845.1 cytosine deaminase [Thermomicrobium sp.]